MKTGAKLCIVGILIDLAGFGMIPLTERAKSTGLYTLGVIAAVALMVIGLVVMLLGFYALQHPYSALPVKKVIVCALIMLATLPLCVLFASWASNATGWVPVGNEALSGAFPACIGVAICIWYWNRKK